MWIFVALVLLGLCLWQARLLGVLRRDIRQLTRATQARQEALLGRALAGVRFVRLPALYKAVNAMIGENRALQATGRSYLGQIEATLGNLREAVLVVDEQGRVVSTNQALRALLNPGTEPVGRRLESVVQSSAFHEYAAHIRGGGEGHTIEVAIETDRQPLFFEVTGARIDPAVIGDNPLTIFVLHDVTRTRRLEAVRTEFVANVSHELRTPVTIMKGFADTLIEDHEELPPEEVNRFLFKIRNNAIRLHNLLEELLLLSRLEERGEEFLKQARQPLNALVRDLAENFETRLPDGAVLQLDLQAAPDVLLLDDVRISQVINNLLDNVLRHARSFSRVTVTTQTVGNAVECTVEDNGAGITEEDLPHVFTRFYRGDKGRSRESGGTGLGLSIVKHIVQIHGGEVFAASEPEVSTRLGFRIPYPEALVEKAVLSVIRKRDA